MATDYSFITHWQINAPLTDVWEVIHDSIQWPQWWKGVVKVVEFKKGDANGVGGIREYTWRSILPYQLSFKMCLTACDKYKRIKGKAFGELEGEGEWLFSEKEGITYVEYHWTVFTNKAWMNYLAFMLKPAFRYNHDVVMGWGIKGLANKLNASFIQ